ncbi:MAG: valine--tRNA ligase [Candidatus Paceibacterota bacterium]
MNEDFLKPYDHSQEKDIYNTWEKSGFFNPENLTPSSSSRATHPFSIIMPPPNANGSLHVGHAVMVAVEDVMVRYWRMRGVPTLWLPGADHAGFETQVVFEKKLEKEGTSRFEILKQDGGREELYNQIKAFTLANKSHMEHQVRQLGASCDWSKETFTLDPKIIDTVYETFKKLYDDGLVYRDTRIVNWCTKHQTTLSDLEVKYEERVDPLYYVKYGPITLATVRLETKFGDTAIAVHPNDARYKNLIGKEIEVEAIAGKTKIKIITDEHVDPAFGTGAVKVTPAHDADDYAIWQRHKDEIGGPKEIIDQFGRMSLASYFADTADVMKYQGLKIAEARKQIAQDMQEKGLIEKVDTDYKHNVALCYKCGTVLEPRVLPQWFIDLTKEGNKKLVQPAINAVKNGSIKIVPEFQEKIFFHWMENIRDWNISRQIVWGIPIPAWHKGKEVYIGKNKPEEEGWTQETDVFDTWFSSGQWPTATLRAQSTSGHDLLEEFYPTNVMETGYDILFFWVARMIMLGIYMTGKIPFKTVYLHGLVRDKDKQKMSKSKGNVVDPMGIVEQYGADALRMALLVGNSPGQDASFDEAKVKGYRNFSNKLWNMARFVLTQPEISNDFLHVSDEDKKILERVREVKKEVAGNIEKYRFSQAGEVAYHYVWHEFADKIIEEKKKILLDKDINESEKESAQKVLYTLLLESLKMLHPFMPFVTEAIYQRLPHKNAKFLMVENWEE